MKKEKQRLQRRIVIGMPKKFKTEFSTFYCTNCGNLIYSLPRRCSALKEPGHLKNLYCQYCKQVHNCAEIRQFGKYTYDDFLLEFEGKNFNEDGSRKVPYQIFLRKKEEQ